MIPTKHITGCPSRSELTAASVLLSKWRMHYFQLLYHEKLTQPGLDAAPFEVVLTYKFSANLRVVCPSHPEYSFDIDWVADEDQASYGQGVLRKCRLILTAISAGKTKVNRLACCPLATPGSCVCDFKSDCPVHGTQCNGGHD